MQTKEGGETLRQTMIAKFGSEEAWKEWMREQGKKGGAASNTGGFASEKVDENGLDGRTRARRVGRIGGRKSKRGPSRKDSDGNIVY